MADRKVFRILMLVWTIVVCAGPVQAADLSVTGSGNPEFVLSRLAEAFNRSQTAHRILVPPSNGTAGALRDVEAGTTSLARVGRPLKEEERKRGLEYVPLGRDAVVFVGGAGVTVRNITANQALAVYTGKITNWRDLGGKPGPIRAIGRETTDASRMAVSGVIKPFGALAFAESVKLVHLDPQLIELLDRYPGSVGFLNRSALKAARTPVSVLAFEGIEPSAVNLIKGGYPLVLEFGLVHRTGGLDEAGRMFLGFIRSSAGVKILREHDVVPVVTGN